MRQDMGWIFVGFAMQGTGNLNRCRRRHRFSADPSQVSPGNTPDFFRLISNTAGGYCFCRDARLLRLLLYSADRCVPGGQRPHGHGTPAQGGYRQDKGDQFVKVSNTVVVGKTDKHRRYSRCADR